MEINREGNLAACQLGSLCQFVQAEEARVAVEGQVTGDLTDHTYATGISLIRPASTCNCMYGLFRLFKSVAKNTKKKLF